MDVKKLIGQKVGRLHVQEYVGARRPPNDSLRHFYRCKCDCGSLVEVDSRNLIHAHTKSCGCLKRCKTKENKGWQGCGDLSGRDWGLIKQKASERKLSVTITIEDAWAQFKAQNSRCALTGWPLTLESVKGSYSNKTASLDRIDSSRGYEVGNIQWLHKDVNLMKSYFSDERFVEVCCAVAAHCNLLYSEEKLT